MKYGMYSICDKLTTYIFPYPAYNDDAAIRQFAAELSSVPMAKANPQDYELFCVGEFDIENGTVEALIPNRHVRSGMSVIRKVDNDEDE